MQMSVKISGGKEIYNALRNLIPREANNIARSGVRAGAALLAKELRRAAPRGPRGAKQSAASKRYGPLYKNIKYRMQRSRGNDHSAIVFIKDAFWWRFVEYGYVQKRKRRKYRVAAHPFVRPVWHRYQQKALDQIMDKMRERIAKVKAV